MPGMKERENNVHTKTAIIFRDRGNRLSFSLFTRPEDGINITRDLENDNCEIVATGSYEDAARMIQREEQQP